MWAGDLNYRVDVDYDAALTAIGAGDWGKLLAADQLSAERARGAAFVGMQEADVAFPPTYKFDKGVPGPAYDSSEKRRVPSWTDRVLFRGARDSGTTSTLTPASVACTGYGCLADVLDSDHKPVWARLTLTVAAVDAMAARAAAAAALNAADGDAPDAPPPPLSVAPAATALRRDTVPTATVAIINSGAARVAWRVRSLDGGALPCWLDVRPAGGALASGASVDIRLEVMNGDTYYSARALEAALAVVASHAAGGGESEARVDVRLAP